MSFPRIWRKQANDLPYHERLPWEIQHFIPGRQSVQPGEWMTRKSTICTVSLKFSTLFKVSLPSRMNSSYWQNDNCLCLHVPQIKCHQLHRQDAFAPWSQNWAVMNSHPEENPHTPTRQDISLFSPCPSPSQQKLQQPWPSSKSKYQSALGRSQMWESYQHYQSVTPIWHW